MAVNKRELFKFLGWLGVALLISGGIRYSVRDLWTVWEKAMIGAGAVCVVVSVVANFAAIRAYFHRRSTRMGANTMVVSVAVIAILAMLNFLGYRHNKRFDLTEEKLYSLSDQTRQVVSHLDRDVTIMVFDKEDHPDLHDLVESYMTLSPRITYQWVDPQEKPEIARQYNIRSLGEMIAVSGGKRERIEEAQEQDITNAILKVTRDETKTVCFIEGHGEKSLADTGGEGYSSVKRGLESENYTVKTINLVSTNEVPSDCTVAVVAGPRQGLFPQEVSLLTKFLDRGGKMMLLLDPDTNPQMDDLLHKWGVAVGDDTVIDVSGVGRLFGTGPAVPLVTDYGDHPITKGFANTMTFFPLARSVKRADDAPTDVQITELLKTSPESWAETELVGNKVKFDEGKDTKGPISLGVVVTKKVEKKQARLVVIGDSDFASNQYIGLQRNGDLFLNAINWLAEDEDLISVRPKSPKNRRVTLTASQQEWLFWFSFVLLPGFVIIAGIYVWWRRR